MAKFGVYTSNTLGEIGAQFLNSGRGLKTRGTCAKKAQEVWAPKKLSSFKPQNTERFRFWSTNPYNAEIFLHKPWMGKTNKNG